MFTTRDNTNDLVSRSIEETDRNRKLIVSKNYREVCRTVEECLDLYKSRVQYLCLYSSSDNLGFTEKKRATTLGDLLLKFNLSVF